MKVGGVLLGTEATTKVERVKMKEILGSIATVVVVAAFVGGMGAGVVVVGIKG